MAKNTVRHRRLCWLMPLVLALPAACGIALALWKWGDKIRDLITVAVKVAVIS